MYFEDFHSLLDMGGHGFYVWTTYGFGCVILAWNLLTPLYQRRKVIESIERRARRQRAQQGERQ